MDWLFTTEEGICHVRVAGILVRDGKLLVQNDGASYAIPGGHLRFGETTEEALIREFQEEMGISIVCGRLLWTEENFWRWGIRDAHNLGYYYLVEFPEDCDIPQAGAVMKDNSGVFFDWLSVDTLDKVTIYPEFLRTELHRLDGPRKHFIRRT